MSAETNDEPQVTLEAVEWHGTLLPALKFQLLTGETLLFRLARPEDIPQLQTLHDELFPVKYSNQFYHEILSSGYVTVVATLRSEEKKSSLTGAPADQQEESKEKTSTARSQEVVIAVATGTLRDTRSGCRKGARQGYIATFGVSKSYRKNGLGAYLLKEFSLLLQTRLKCDSIALHVHAENHAAIRMYSAEGYETIQRLPAHYHFDGADQDALLLLKTLTATNKASSFYSSSYCAIL